MYPILFFISCLLILSVFITLVRSDYWIFKVMEYPRLQKLILVLLAIIGWLFYWPLAQMAEQIIFGGLCLSVVYLVYKIAPYTFIIRKEMKRVTSYQPGDAFKILSANVYQDNHQYERLLQQIRTENPDLIFLLETNKDWAEAMQVLKKDYPYHLEQPLENTYGLLFFSRLPMEKASVKFLVKKDIPSIEAVVQLPSGKKLQLWGLHPEPPVPNESLYSTAKDKELMKIALKARDCTMPCIVFGDLNDVAWSHTTELFRKTSELLDPRRGRGFYNTFSAHHWYMRFPLDYVFCSKEFGLIQMKRLPKNGSDHFATVVHLSYIKNVQEQSPPHADSAELKEAEEIAHQKTDHLYS